jgi:hypothetical protein
VPIARRLADAGFGVLLAALGLLMEVASRLHPAFRRQVTRDLVVEVSSAGGAAHHYAFTAGDRRVASRRGPAPEPTIAVRFDSSLLGLRCLLSPHAVGSIVQALLARRATVRGNAVILLWFYGLTRLVIPYARQRRLGTPLPGTIISPDPASRVAARTTREPAAAELDPAWTDAAARRARMAMLRVAAGERIPMW